MEEAAVLCDRLGIFVDGELICIGGPKELTARHCKYYVSSGLELVLHVRPVCNGDNEEGNTGSTF